MPGALLSTWVAGLTPKLWRPFIGGEGLRWPREILVVNSDPKPVLQLHLGSSQGFVSLRKVVDSCSVLRAFHKVVTDQALP